eukprot:scaffold7770_cov121-Skeletonema_marinoi.AAC.3
MQEGWARPTTLEGNGGLYWLLNYGVGDDEMMARGVGQTVRKSAPTNQRRKLMLVLYLCIDPTSKSLIGSNRGKAKFV